jgi:hypothetical protein
MYVSRTIQLVLIMYIYKQIIVKIKNSVLTVNCNNSQLNSSNIYTCASNPCFRQGAGGGGVQCHAGFRDNKDFSVLKRIY